MSPLEAHAREMPERIAYRMIPSGKTVTWRELELRSRKCAAALLEAGLQPGDVIAVFLENHPCYFELLWAAHRIGLYYTTISRHLKREEAGYLIENSDARALFYSECTRGETDARGLDARGVLRICVDGADAGAVEYEAWAGRHADDVRLPQTPEGTDFLYSSGTTGLPKGIKRPLSVANRYFRVGDAPSSAWKAFDRNTVYLSTAPFYHAAPVRWNMAALRAGGTCVMMEKFDPAGALAAIAAHGVTHSQWVPTMFIRLLRLPEAERARHDLSSLRYAVHAAAPCPAEVKEAMIGWWGPILYEYYSGTELVGRTSLGSEEWLAHRGSVGRPEFGQVHIMSEDGLRELPPGQPGVIYFSGGGTFEYHKDPEKTRGAHNARGWATYGDIGHLDADGYLYLTDRLSNMIVSGGVNIYPQEAENLLCLHPAVADVAVVGVPNDEFGEEVKAVVQLRDPASAGPDLAQQLIAYCRERISPIKCPKSVDFSTDMPRTETGKLLKRLVKQRYWPSPKGGAR
ncbi:AMP-binding protein [Achromobacter veterisilvae]|jgi:long-chain acyl-CoA synthetase|uniref:AMP-binding protein n=1 Tax=Achromobacter veterisilvae TaxID=2069367 RepID=A0A446CU86_9BURK|nr:MULTISPECIES: AMP-binding protein [Achromobacter]MCW0211243.1 AMP-binding protein [Achromobacter sp.]SSW71375.1 Long-chain-fatty-acid--CoA ligase FadD13 [Achromobacter veterisilvae]